MTKAIFVFLVSSHSMITFKAKEFIDQYLFANFEKLKQIRFKDPNYQVFVLKALA